MTCPYCSRPLKLISKDTTPLWDVVRKSRAWETELTVTVRAYCDTCRLDFEETTHPKALFPVREMGRWRLPGDKVG